MSWMSANMEANGKSFIGWVKPDNQFAIPFLSDFGVGDHLKVGGKVYQAITVVDNLDRNEQLLISGKEVKDAKSKARRNDP